jgi:hypothetical protein
MKEIYWLTRLDTLSAFFEIMTVMMTIIIVCLLLLFFVDVECLLMDAEKRRKYTRISAFILSISALGNIFIPSSKEAMMILGVGQTIDYIQENGTVKELPDKCVKALEEWVDSLIEEE